MKGTFTTRSRVHSQREEMDSAICTTSLESEDCFQLSGFGRDDIPWPGVALNTAKPTKNSNIEQIISKRFHNYPTLEQSSNFHIQSREISTLVGRAVV